MATNHSASYTSTEEALFAAAAAAAGKTEAEYQHDISVFFAAQVPAQTLTVVQSSYTTPENTELKNAAAAEGITIATFIHNAVVVTLQQGLPPTVAITSPGTITLNTPTPFTATASAALGQGIISVSFLIDGVAIGTPDSIAPYMSSPLDPATLVPGDHILTAVAVQTDNQSTTSAPITVHVPNPASATTPTVTLTSPTNAATISTTTAFTATAADGGAGTTISQVEFYAGGTLLTTDTSSPYAGTSINPLNFAAGTLQLKAIVRQSDGQANTAIINVTIPAAPKPTVSITAPGSGATLTTPTAFTGSASAGSNVTSITGLSFYVNGTLKSTDTTSPYAAANLVDADLLTGDNQLSILATQSDGQTQTTSITVHAPTGTAGGGGANPVVTVTGITDGQLLRTSQWSRGAYSYAGGSFPWGASVTPATGKTISSVDFKINGSLISTDTTAPYQCAQSLDATTLPAGPNTLTVVAHQSDAATTTVNITVVPEATAQNSGYVGHGHVLGDLTATGSTGNVTTLSSLGIANNGTLSLVHVRGSLSVDRTGVTITDCWLEQGFSPISSGKNFTVQWTEIGPTDGSYGGGGGCGDDSYTARYCDLHHFGDGFRANGPNTIEYCYVHDLQDPTGLVHNDCIQGTSCNGAIVVRYNTLLLNMGETSCFSPLNTTTFQHTVENNLWAGGGYALYPQISTGAGSTYKNNVFDRRYFDKCGINGPLYRGYPTGTATCTGNIYENGLPAKDASGGG